MTEKIRSFISVDIDDENLIDELKKMQCELQGTDADLKLVETENIHLTLKFLGEITPSTVNAVVEELKSVNFAPFTLRLQGLGAFPNIGRINVIWAGITKGKEQLKQIAERIETVTSQIGFRPDSKGFSPHLTIARVRSGRNRDKLAIVLKMFYNHDIGEMIVKSIRLKRSILTPTGPIYSTIFEISAHAL